MNRDRPAIAGRRGATSIDLHGVAAGATGVPALLLSDIPCVYRFV